MQAFEPKFCMFFLIFCSLKKDLRNLFVAVFFGLAGIVRIFVAGLGFAGERGLKVGFCF